jgi:aminoglycoside 3'-phosphotransferase-1
MADERERACGAAAVPAGMAAEVAGYAWARDLVGQSGGAVYRLHGKAGSPDLFLKHGAGAVADDVADEMERLRWLAGYVPVPAVRQFIRTADQAWLLMTALDGRTAYEVMAARADARLDVADALAAFLRRLHAIPVGDCPFDSGHGLRLSKARARIEAGLVDVDDFDDAREGWTAEQVWAAMHDLLPIEPESVVTHGDVSLDNLLIRDGAVVGCIDVGRAGIADRYQDIAIAWNSLEEFGTAVQDRFLQRYGIPEPDARKLHFHLMLDEFF